MFQTLRLNLTKLWKITKEHPELVKEVTFKDGRKEKYFNLTASTSRWADEYHTEDLSAKPKDVKPQSKEEWRYWDVGTAKVFPDNASSASDDKTPF